MTPRFDLISTKRARRRVLAVAALASLAAFALPTTASAAADTCSGSTDRHGQTDVFVSIKCTFASTFFDILATKTIDDVSGFEGLQCVHLMEDKDGGEGAPPGITKNPTNWLRCDQPQGPAKPRPQAAATTGVTGMIRSVDGPACGGGTPLRLSVQGLNPPPGTDPQDIKDVGYDNAWLRGPFPLSEVCGDTEGFGWIYAANSQKASKAGSVRALFSCTAECTVTARGTIRLPSSAARSTTIKLKTLVSTLSANRTRVLKWKLTNSQRKRLKGKRAKLRVTATGVDATGARSTLSQTSKLR